MWRPIPATVAIALSLFMPALPAERRFPVPLDLCALLTKDEVRPLVPAARKPEGEHSGRETMGCQWVSRGVGLAIGVGVSTPGLETWDFTPEQAHDFFRKAYNQALGPSSSTLWAWGEIGMDVENRPSASESRARPLKGVGDEAFTYDYTDERTKRVERSLVVFRVGNLILELDYAALDGRVSAKRLRDSAVRAAKSTVKALDRLSPPTTPAPQVQGPPLGCSLLTDSQLKRLFGGRPRMTALHAGGCSWEGDDRDMTLWVWLLKKGPAGDGLAQAREFFAAWDQAFGLSPGARKPQLTDIGDEAFSHGAERASAVAFRVGDLMAEAKLSERSAGAARQDVEKAARWIAESMERSSD